MEKKQYQCRHCKYRFARKEQPPRCPYCDRTGTLTEMGNSPADDLIKQSEF